MSDRPKTTKTAWKKAAVHNICLESGVRVDIRIPDLPVLIESGELPQHLIDAALGVASGQQQTPTVDLIKKEREFTDFLILRTVVDPVLEPADVRELPPEDKELLVRIATRRTDLDAEGEHIGGLSSSEKFRRFRRLGEFDPALEGL